MCVGVHVAQCCGAMSLVWAVALLRGARVKTAGAAERNYVNKTKHPVVLMDMCVLYPADLGQEF
jgi:hypothetical protein